MWIIIRFLALLAPPVGRDLDFLLTRMAEHEHHFGQDHYSLVENELLQRAIVAAEDRRYWRHPGVDLRASVRAVYFYLVEGKVSGASTIEQQLVRTLRKRYEVTLLRKLSEIVLAFFVSNLFSKRRILQTYMSVAYFGWSATGVDAVAARLGVESAEISFTEAATIAAMLKLPMPRYPSEKYTQRLSMRVRYVLKTMQR